jgi:glycosyltransferase involved in cell wall biosynthesis
LAKAFLVRAGPFVAFVLPNPETISARRHPFDMHATETSFHLLTFEGHDAYARAGGLASRVIGLSETLANLDLDTHVWFVGDPELPGHETRGRLRLHRWCQWISRYHPRGVYDGDEGKQSDYAASLPPFLCREIVSALQARPGKRFVILAEEWQTVDAVLHLDWLLKGAGVRDRVRILWNANNTFGFDRIDWQRLRGAATITTVSRYMRHLMWQQHVDALVLPNGLPAEAYDRPAACATRELRSRLQGRTSLTKIARWDPDKRWLLGVDTVAAMKHQGFRPLLIARGGQEAHGGDVLARAAQLGLRVAVRRQADNGVTALLGALDGLADIDLVNLEAPLAPAACRVLYRSADAVLANSSHEPFGLVGLEAMAAGGLACVGGTGEDYAQPGWNALVLQENDPRELIRTFARIASNPPEAATMRRRGMAAARQFAWREVVRRNILPFLDVPIAAPVERPRKAALTLVEGHPDERKMPLAAAAAS